MRTSYYFSHDYNARTDSKIKRLIAKHGMCGYGVFWAIIEDLYNNANALPTDYESIAFDIRSDADIVKSVVCDFDLFVVDGSYFGSTSVERRLNERNEKSKYASENAKARWLKHRIAKENDANALQPQYDGNAIKERKGKEKERKVNEKKENESKSFTPPKLDEVMEYFAENGYTPESAKKAFAYYKSGEWKDSKGNPVKSWKQKMHGVWFKPENEIKKPEQIERRLPLM